MSRHPTCGDCGHQILAVGHCTFRDSMGKRCECREPRIAISQAEWLAIKQYARNPCIKATAAALGKSQKTVQIQIATARRKIGAPNALFLVLALFRRELLTLEDFPHTDFPVSLAPECETEK